LVCALAAEASGFGESPQVADGAFGVGTP
jgi:hypothetical protein